MTVVGSRWRKNRLYTIALQRPPLKMNVRAWSGAVSIYFTIDSYYSMALIYIHYCWEISTSIWRIHIKMSTSACSVSDGNVQIWLQVWLLLWYRKLTKYDLINILAKNCPIFTGKTNSTFVITLPQVRRTHQDSSSCDWGVVITLYIIGICFVWTTHTHCAHLMIEVCTSGANFVELVFVDICKSVYDELIS